MRNEAATVELRQNAVDAELFLQPAQAIGDLIRRANENLAVQRLFIAEVFDPPQALGPPLDRPRASAAERVPQPLRLLTVEVHQAFPRLLARTLLGFGEISWDAQINLSSALVARRRIGFAILLDLGNEFGKRAEGLKRSRGNWWQEEGFRE